MNLSLDPADLEPIVEAALDAVLARRETLDAKLAPERLGFPEREAAASMGIQWYTLRNARLAGEISGRKVGRSVVYSRAALIRWLEAAE